MSKVTGKIKLIKDPRKGWVLVPIDLNNLRQQAVDKWVKGDASQSILLDIELKQPYEEKTLSQLGYLHAAVWPVFYAYYQTQGIPVENEQVREYVRDDVKWAIGFTEQIDSLWSDGFIVKVKSFANASKEETSEAIDAIIRLAAEFGMVVQSPEEYLHKHGATKFEE
jgi:ABC-type transport system involved in Fe-S cluster assembly fused permease/ATPase subunit